MTDFVFEIIVSDDCSTDGTREIVQQFERDYPGFVKPIYRERNIGGGTHNFLTVHQVAIGDYVAHVYGDDYCLPGKLQAQADILDAEPECNMVFHRMLLKPFGEGEQREGPLSGVADLDKRRFFRATS